MLLREINKLLQNPPKLLNQNSNSYLLIPGPTCFPLFPRISRPMSYYSFRLYRCQYKSCPFWQHLCIFWKSEHLLFKDLCNKFMLEFSLWEKLSSPPSHPVSLGRLSLLFSTDKLKCFLLPESQKLHNSHAFSSLLTVKKFNSAKFKA